LLCNLLTNPPANVISLVYFNIWGPEHYVFVVVLLELAIVAIEAYVIHLMMEYKRFKALGISLLLNACSFGIGLWLL